MCGGNLKVYDCKLPWAGLSPRVRGKQPLLITGYAETGSIPACAGETECSPSRGSGGSVYPRVCGGKRNLHGVPRIAIRSIPACAGETAYESDAHPQPAVYPRVCGGNDRMIIPSRGLTGLSPRVRGKQATDAYRRMPEGSIPACAGETNNPCAWIGRGRVYPRVCGGNASTMWRMGQGTGLSPRVRGKRKPGLCGRAFNGSIPACAGETGLSMSEGLGNPVYPRVCGGNNQRSIRFIIVGGLSPRVRGKPFAVCCAAFPPRSIPACAGETGLRRTKMQTPRVYPRVCGGNFQHLVGANNYAGLSPRVRGKQLRHRRLFRRRGSIPACAGETGAAGRRSSYSEVYPRVCGGNNLPLRLADGRLGLSPRVRGKPNRRQQSVAQRGSIPACAGETVHYIPTR